MSTSPAEQPGSGIVTFTQEGERALDRLAADLVDHCDGSAASIADISRRCCRPTSPSLPTSSASPPSPARPALPTRAPTMQPVDASAPTGPLPAALLSRNPGSADEAPVTSASAPPTE